jgi:hypothetical protein
MLARGADSALPYVLVRPGFAIVILALCTCGRNGDRPPPSSAPVPAEEPAAAGSAADLARPAPAPPPPLAEVAARSLLAGALRGGGLRILQDVRVQGTGYDVTLDGWDPARRIGFEYIAPEEVDTDLDAAERAALAADATLTVLILDAAAEAAIQPRLDTFLASLPPK